MSVPKLRQWSHILVKVRYKTRSFHRVHALNQRLVQFAGIAASHQLNLSACVHCFRSNMLDSVGAGKTGLHAIQRIRYPPSFRVSYRRFLAGSIVLPKHERE